MFTDKNIYPINIATDHISEKYIFLFEKKSKQKLIFYIRIRIKMKRIRNTAWQDCHITCFTGLPHHYMFRRIATLLHVSQDCHIITCFTGLPHHDMFRRIATLLHVSQDCHITCFTGLPHHYMFCRIATSCFSFRNPSVWLDRCHRRTNREAVKTIVQLLKLY